MYSKLPKPDIFFVEEIYPALLSDVKITYSPKEKSSDNKDDLLDELLDDLINFDYDVTFEFVVYNGVRHRSFYRKFEKILTSGRSALSSFCYQMVDQPYWETNTDEWKDFCKSFELNEFFGSYMNVNVEDFSIPKVLYIDNSNYYETDGLDEEFDYDSIFKSYKCRTQKDYRYAKVNEAIREGLMHYFD